MLNTVRNLRTEKKKKADGEKTDVAEVQNTYRLIGRRSDSRAIL